MSKIVLYHGSEKIVEKPELKLGKVNNDYGQGFYCTQDIELAKEWARKHNVEPSYVNKYELDLDGLKILNIGETKHEVITWIAVLIKNRKFSKNPMAQTAAEKISQKFSIDLTGYDVIIGYRADDSYFSFAKAFLDNTLSLNQLGVALKLGNLGLQVALLSEKATQKLKFVSSETVSEEYYYKFLKRDQEAREAFFKTIRENGLDPDGLRVLDIIKDGFDTNDPRIQ